MMPIWISVISNIAVAFIAYMVGNYIGWTDANKFWWNHFDDVVQSKAEELVSKACNRVNERIRKNADIIEFPHKEADDGIHET